MEISRLNKNRLVEKRYDRPTIQQIAESLYKGGFSKHDKGRYAQ